MIKHWHSARTGCSTHKNCTISLQFTVVIPAQSTDARLPSGHMLSDTIQKHLELVCMRNYRPAQTRNNNNNSASNFSFIHDGSAPKSTSHTYRRNGASASL